MEPFHIINTFNFSFAARYLNFYLFKQKILPPLQFIDQTINGLFRKIIGIFTLIVKIIPSGGPKRKMHNY